MQSKQGAEIVELYPIGALSPEERIAAASCAMARARDDLRSICGVIGATNIMMILTQEMLGSCEDEKLRGCLTLARRADGIKNYFIDGS